MALKKVISYKVGYGDCLLLCFEDKSNSDDKYYLLVDCGIRKAADKLVVSSLIKCYGCDTDNTDNSQNKLLSLVRLEVEKDIRECKKPKEMNILITHFDEDHYKGLRNTKLDVAFKNITIKKMFVPTKDVPESINDFMNYHINNHNMIIQRLYVTNEPYELHTYPSGNRETINILWPNKVCNELPDLNYTSLVFEVQNTADQWCLFTGDADIRLYINNNGETNYKQLFNPSKKYSFIKAPHHGTEDWPLDFAADNCTVLITSCASYDKTSIHSLYFSYSSIGKLYITNCSENCTGKQMDFCSKCSSVSGNKVIVTV